MVRDLIIGIIVLLMLIPATLIWCIGVVWYLVKDAFWGGYRRADKWMSEDDDLDSPSKDRPPQP